ncbi:MAG: multicopper oxidase domain-containing protein [Acidobacteriota bacterium]
MPPEINQLPPRTVPARRTRHLHQQRLSGRLDRRAFAVDDYFATNTLPLRYIAAPQPPANHEMAWKNVVQCPPGMFTRIAVPFRGYAGRYVWHCHILRHQT